MIIAELDQLEAKIRTATELMTRLLVRVPLISLVNLTLGREAVPELVQEAASGPRLGEEALRLLGDAAAMEAQRRAFRGVGEALGEPGVAVSSAKRQAAPI